MNTRILLPPHLFSPTTGQIDKTQLETVVEEHPYCSIAQFYLLTTLSDQPENTRSSQASKTALFFNNTSWLHWQLLQKDQIEDDSPVPFEPLHVVDYFASQGITITEETGTGDKLGKQLKSFTEWLKTMKKIHTERMEPGNELADQKIQTIAEGSNINTDVVTEAMAEVLEKQGKIEKAIEIYSKLSLTDPAKNAYFAAKIDRLKGV